MAQPASGQQDQSSRNTILLIGAIVVILIAVFVIVRTYQQSQPHIVAHSNVAPFSGMKGPWLKAQKEKQNGGAAAGAAPQSAVPGPGP